MAVGSFLMPSLFGGEGEGVLQTRQTLGLEAKPGNRGLPITGSQSPGPTIQTNKQTNPCKVSTLTCRIIVALLLLIFEFFSKGYSLIRKAMFINFNQ